MAGQTASWNIQVNNISAGQQHVGDDEPVRHLARRLYPVQLQRYGLDVFGDGNRNGGLHLFSGSERRVFVQHADSHRECAVELAIVSIEHRSGVRRRRSEPHQPGRRGDEQHGFGERNRRHHDHGRKPDDRLQQQRQERHAFCHRHQPGGTVSVGTITFSVFQGATQIGSSTSPAGVTNGSASATYTLPGGTSAGTYSIVASYTGAGNFASSSDNTHTLTVIQAIGTCTTANPNPNPNPVSFAAVGDFNGDCKTDILWRNTGTSRSTSG